MNHDCEDQAAARYTAIAPPITSPMACTERASAEDTPRIVMRAKLSAKGTTSCQMLVWGKEVAVAFNALWSGLAVLRRALLATVQPANTTASLNYRIRAT